MTVCFGPRVPAVIPAEAAPRRGWPKPEVGERALAANAWGPFFSGNGPGDHPFVLSDHRASLKTLALEHRKGSVKQKRAGT
jgi:hypothetical protein